MRWIACLLVVACGGGGARVAEPKLASGAQRVELDGVDIAYEIRGKGPACVVMPGGPGLSSSYLQSAELEQHVTAIYVDPAGTGGSADLTSNESYSIRRDVAILEALRKDLGLERWCLIGHSYGGLVVLRYVLDHPEHTSGLMLYSTSPSLGDEWQKQVATRIAMFKDEPWYADAVKAQRAEGEAKNPDELDAAMRGELPLYFAEWTARSSDYADAVAKMKLDFEVARRRPDEKFEVRSELAKIRVPTVIVVGDRDAMFGPPIGAWLASGIKNAKLVTIENAGHFSHIEQPAKFGAAAAALADAIAN